MIEDAIIKELGFNRVRIDEPLADHVYMKVGWPADYFYQATSSEELSEAAKIALVEKIPLTILGNGANVLIADKGVRGLVIQNSSKEIKFLPHGFVLVDSGVSNTDLIVAAKNRQLTGMERLLKVPGTVGGAVFMNAGDTGKKAFFGDLVVAVEALGSDGGVKKLTQRQCGFRYRNSRFHRTGEIILRVKLQLKPATKQEIEDLAKDILIRKAEQPAGSSVGSTFKNPKEGFAGQLIEKAGLKGTKIGSAKISERHGNFIINEGNATAADIKALIDLMKKMVKEKFGVELEEEVRYIGEWGYL